MGAIALGFPVSTVLLLILTSRSRLALVARLGAIDVHVSWVLRALSSPLPLLASGVVISTLGLAFLTRYPAVLQHPGWVGLTFPLSCPVSTVFVAVLAFSNRGRDGHRLRLRGSGGHTAASASSVLKPRAVVQRVDLGQINAAESVPLTQLALSIRPWPSINSLPAVL